MSSWPWFLNPISMGPAAPSCFLFLTISKFGSPTFSDTVSYQILTTTTYVLKWGRIILYLFCFKGSDMEDDIRMDPF